MAAILKGEIAYRVEGAFEGKRGKPASDLSGIACMPPRPDGSRVCVLINDENRHAQFATLKGETFYPGANITLVDAELTGVLGARPQTNCPGGEDDPDEFDGEGVAYAAPYFYIVGSHGCSRRKGRFNPASFILARIRVDENGNPADAEGKAVNGENGYQATAMTYRLSDILQRADKVGAYFGRSLGEAENGLNIEGIAADGNSLIVGLRAPSIDGTAFLVRTDLESLFAEQDDQAHGEPDVIPLKLGSQIGIRDLSWISDGRLLVLAGPAQEQDVPYRLFLADLRAGGDVVELGEIASPSVEEGDDDDSERKAEAIAVLGAADDGLDVLLLFDGMENGGGIGFRVTLR